MRVAKILDHSPVTHAIYHAKKGNVWPSRTIWMYVTVLVIIMVATARAGTAPLGDATQDTRFLSGVLFGTSLGLILGWPTIFATLFSTLIYNKTEYRKFMSGIVCGTILGSALNYTVIKPTLKKMVIV